MLTNKQAANMKLPPLDDDPVLNTVLYAVYAIAAAVITITWGSAP